MSALHTPGPWVAQKDGYAVLSEDWLIGTPGGRPDEVAVCSKRDAALIAAAPELLAELQHALRFWDQLGPADAARMQSVINKATGSAE